MIPDTQNYVDYRHRKWSDFPFDATEQFYEQMRWVAESAQSSGGEIAFATLAKIERAVVGIMAAIEDGMYQPSMTTRMAEPEQRRPRSLRASPKNWPIPLMCILAWPKIYKRKVERLTETLGAP